MVEIDGARIVITGGAGFVGSHIADHLLERGASEVILLDNLLRGSLSNIAQALSTGRTKFVEGDIRDRRLLGELLMSSDYCFHMAALRITRCRDNPREALEVMYDGTFNVIEACLNHGVKKLVIASSASVYGQAEVFPTTEEHHFRNNRTLYGAAKAANELMCYAFSDMSGLKWNALRYFNVYGPRMDTEGKYTEVLIRWYRLIKQGKAPVIFGDGSQTMDFVHVRDVARATVLALLANVTGEVFNVARGEETSLKQLAGLLLQTLGSDLLPDFVPLPEERKAVEVWRRLADTSKASRLLNFEAEYDLPRGLADLIAWLDTQPEIPQ